MTAPFPTIPPTSGDPPRLALRPKEAAIALGISERLLWARTNCGDIPCVRIGRSVRYSVSLLDEWLIEKAGEVRSKRSDRKNK